MKYTAGTLSALYIKAHFLVQILRSFSVPDEACYLPHMSSDSGSDRGVPALNLVVTLNGSHYLKSQKWIS